MSTPHWLATLSTAQAMPASAWIPGVLLAQLYLLFFACLAFSHRRLPGRVTTQFNLLGRPKHQMSRAAYLIFMGIFGVCFPLSGLIIYVVGKANPGSLKIPNRAYWLAQEHLAEAQAYLLRHSLWFGCLTLGFLIGVHFVIIGANRRHPPRLPWPLLLVLVATFGVAMIVWSQAGQLH